MTTPVSRPTGHAPGRPRVLVIGTGGTIAGSAAAATGHAYDAGVLTTTDILAAVPEAADRVELVTEQVFSLDSVDLTLDHRLRLARHIHAALHEAETAGTPFTGVVVTHGTDTLEDTATLLHLVLDTPTPIVLVGAMRPADAPGADGPANLADAIAVATSPAATGLGVLVVMAGHIHAGSHVRKRSAAGIEAFASEYGPLGDVVDGVPHLFLRPRPGGSFPITDLPEHLPQVVTLLDSPDLPETIRQAVIDAEPAALVHVGAGAGNVDAATAVFLRRARETGIVVIRASATGGGIVARNGAVDDDTLDTVAAGRHSPVGAALLAALALTRTHDTAELQHIYDTH